ncbi:hypothetical protein BU25DRAFT_178002 [Macroventuria anomochaeta]|uniref:Uncharacterized protein n=1 Tax=Macroventuria anomochaeta TaxID=301207 RepID=A0ACB6RQH5_9PLEO|nr:uncharacterized protein BU25DRAFT_178002 [Macroventuria anomochaeta]KAF2623378.1 hypothetical protein BU25DRAFT_178002 [Macroventuria anomochaeta]
MDNEKRPAAPISPLEQKPSLPETFTARSLYPLYVLAKSQRRLLSKVKVVLEHACYTFGKVAMAHGIPKQGWDSPDCVKLNVWVRLFKSEENLFDARGIAAIGKPLPDLQVSKFVAVWSVVVY